MIRSWLSSRLRRAALRFSRASSAAYELATMCGRAADRLDPPSLAPPPEVSTEGPLTRAAREHAAHLALQRQLERGKLFGSSSTPQA